MGIQFQDILHFSSATPGVSSLGVLGVPWHTQILADQLTLFQPGGDRLCPPDYYWHTRIFRPSDGPCHVRKLFIEMGYISLIQKSSIICGQKLKILAIVQTAAKHTGQSFWTTMQR